MEENKPLVTETEYPESDTDIISGDGTPIIDTSDQNVDTVKEESTTSKPDAGESTENSSTNTEENGEEEDTTTEVTIDPANDPATLESALLVSTYAALNKLAEYVPTEYVDKSVPDINAEHLNNTEQGLLRVTNLLNGAVDVINDLQTTVAKQASAIDTLNSNVNALNTNKAERLDLVKIPSLQSKNIKCLNCLVLIISPNAGFFDLYTCIGYQSDNVRSTITRIAGNGKSKIEYIAEGSESGKRDEYKVTNTNSMSEASVYRIQLT